MWLGKHKAIACTVDDASVKNRLTECLETILNKAQEPPKSKKVQHSNAKNAVLFEAINLIIHMDSDPNLLVRGCNQLGQFLQHRETNLRSASLFWSSSFVFHRYFRVLALLKFPESSWKQNFYFTVKWKVLENQIKS